MIRYTVFAKESAGVEPRRANLYAFDMNNPLRYLDPDGRDVVQVDFGGKTNPATDSQTVSAIAAIMGKNAIVGITPDGKGNQKISISQSASQKSKSTRGQTKFAALANDSKKLVVIYNIDRSTSNQMLKRVLTKA